MKFKTFEEFINEKKSNNVTEDILYHFTSVYGVVGIIEDKKIKTNLNRDYMDAKSSSFTTDFNFHKKSISGFKVGKKAVCLVFDAAAMRKDNIKMYYHIYAGTKDFDYSKEAEVRVDGNVSTKYLQKVIFIENKAIKDPHFYKEALKFVKKKNITYEIY